MPRPRSSPLWHRVEVFLDRKVWRCPYCWDEFEINKHSLDRIRSHLTGNKCQYVPVWIREEVRQELGLDPPPPPQPLQLEPLPRLVAPPLQLEPPPGPQAAAALPPPPPLPLPPPLQPQFPAPLPPQLLPPPPPPPLQAQFPAPVPPQLALAPGSGLVEALEMVDSFFAAESPPLSAQEPSSSKDIAGSSTENDG